MLVADATFPGCRIRVRPIGVFHMRTETRGWGGRGEADEILAAARARERSTHGQMSGRRS